MMIMLRSLRFLFVLPILWSMLPNAAGQKVFAVDSQYDADVKVYVTDSRYDADLWVYKVSSQYDAEGNKGLWFFDDSRYDANQLYLHIYL